MRIAQTRSILGALVAAIILAFVVGMPSRAPLYCSIVTEDEITRSYQCSNGVEFKIEKSPLAYIKTRIIHGTGEQEFAAEQLMTDRVRELRVTNIEVDGISLRKRPSLVLRGTLDHEHNQQWVAVVVETIDVTQNRCEIFLISSEAEERIEVMKCSDAYLLAETKLPGTSTTKELTVQSEEALSFQLGLG